MAAPSDYKEDDDDHFELTTLLEDGDAPPLRTRHHDSDNKSRPRRRSRLLQIGCVVLVVVSVLQLTGYALESTIGTFRFHASLAGVSSEHYCPDYVPLVRQFLDPYRNPSGSVEALQQEIDFLKQRCSPLRIRSGTVTFPSNPGNDKRRHQDLKANVELAQTLYGRLPDLDVWFNPSDAPSVPRDAFPDPPAMPPPLAYFTTSRHRDLSMPYLRLEVWNEADVAQKLDVLVDAHRWKDKLNRGIWRGSTTGQPEPTDENYLGLTRAKLVNISLHHPDLLDARLTSCKQCHGHVKERFKELGYGYAKFVTYEDMFDYTMLVDVDGNSWSSRFPQLLSINCAIFKQETENVEWFRTLLVPYVHYIPVREDISDLYDKMRNFSAPERSRDLEAIAHRSTDFYRKLLLPSKQLCYLHLLLKEYASIKP